MSTAEKKRREEGKENKEGKKGKEKGKGESERPQTQNVQRTERKKFKIRENKTSMQINPKRKKSKREEKEDKTYWEDPSRHGKHAY